MQPILDIADLAQRREAAEATADGAALFYAFGNFCALAAKPDLESLQAMNALKGRPLDQVGSVTTTPERANRVFDWDEVDAAVERAGRDHGRPQALGPIGFRGPAAAHIPAHLTQHGTVQLITPGDRCPTNALVGDVLDLIDEDILYITSANTSSHVSKQIEAAHYEIREIQREFGMRDDVVLIGHRNERANRRLYPYHLPCSTSIVAFDQGELVLERLGSLDADMIDALAERHGLNLRSVPARERARPRGRSAVPVRKRPARRSASSARLGSVSSAGARPLAVAPARALDLHLLGQEVGPDHEDRGGELRADRLDRRVDAEPQARPVRQRDVDRRDRHPAGALHRARGLADHHDEHEADEDAGDDQHLLVGQLALEVERDAGRRRSVSARPRPAPSSTVAVPAESCERLQEQHGLEALAVHARQPEHEHPDRLRRR